MKVRQLTGLGALPCNGSTTFVMGAGGTIAAPCTLVFLGSFQGLQRAINEVMKKHGFAIELRVDGDIGPDTVSAAQQAWAVLRDDALRGLPQPSSAQQLAENAEDYRISFGLETGKPIDITPNPAETKQSFEFGEGTVTVLPSVQSPATTKKAGMGGILFLSTVVGIIAYRIVGKKA